MLLSVWFAWIFISHIVSLFRQKMLLPSHSEKTMTCFCGRKGGDAYTSVFPTLFSFVKLHFEVDPVMVLQVWVISIPVPPSPKRCCHFIKKFALCFVTEYMLSQALSSVRFLLPHFLLVSSLLPGRHKLFSWTDNAVISRW